MPEGRSSPRQDLIADVGKLLQQDSAEATRKLAAAVHDGRPDAQTDEMKHHFPTRRFDRYTQPRSHFGETLFNRRSERTSQGRNDEGFFIEIREPELPPFG